VQNRAILHNTARMPNDRLVTVLGNFSAKGDLCRRRRDAKPPRDVMAELGERAELDAASVLAYICPCKPEIFYALFYRRARFRCETAQLCDTRCELGSAYSPMKSTLCDAVKTYAIR
jgi:hypothetical protein